MADSLNSLIGTGGESWSTSEQDTKRQAIASLRGYAYQLHQSLAAWIALPDDATLHLEISEDYAQIARDPGSLETVLTATQVKDTRESGSVTLNSPDVKAAIRHFWALRDANSGRAVRFVFLTTSPIGQERIDPFADGPGLDLWHRATRSGSVEGLRAGLIQRFSSEADERSGLASFIRDSGDDDLRKGLIAPIRWIAGAPPIESIAADNCSALITLGQQFGGLPDFSARAADKLLATVLDTIIRDGDRRLRRGELLLAIQEAVSVRVPAQQALLGQTHVPRGLDLDATGAWRLISSPPLRSAPREAAIKDLRAALSPDGGVWLHGATGLGKSMLAELAANAIGGPWRLLDLRGATGPIARERLVAARLAILADPDVAGLVIDDLSPDQEHDIEGSLTELALSLQQRGIPLIVTSNQLPGHRLKRALELPESAIHAAPSFESEDASALVAAYGGDPAKWAWFALLVGSGHPQLVDVAIAGLAQKGWPDDAMRAWASAGMKNSDVEAEREAARRRLLAELAPDVLGLLARTARIYGTFDRELGIAVGGVAPSLAAPGLALDQLTGHRIERLFLGRLRSSPLVFGLDQEMLDADALEALDLAIVKHILTRKSVEADLLDTAFYHTWLAGDASWLNWLVQFVIHTDDEDRPKLASLMPMFRAATADPAFLEEWPFPKLLFRLAQHLLTSSIGTDAEVAASAQSLIHRLDAMDEADGEARRSAERLVLMKLLFDAYGHGRIPGWFDQLQRFARIAEHDPAFRTILERVGASSEADPMGFLFIAHAVRLPNVLALADLFDALENLPTTARQKWLDAMNEPPIALAMIIDNAWLKETRREGFDAQETADTFAQLGAMAIGWRAGWLAGRCFRAQALIIDEYVKDSEAAYSALDAAAEFLPDNFDIERERGKIAWRAQDYKTAYRILHGLEDRYGDADAIDAAFALREAAISAAQIGKSLEAARLFNQARTFALEGRDGQSSPMSVGLAADAAAARFGAGEEAAAVREMTAVLEDLVAINSNKELTSHSVHLLVRHLILWMFDKHKPLLVDGEKPFYPPGAASNPDPKPELADLPVTSLAPAWMLLARTGLLSGVPVEEVIAWPGLIAAREDPTLDSMVRFDLLDHAITNGDLDGFRRFLLPAVESLVHVDDKPDVIINYDPRVTSTGVIPKLAPGTLMEGRARSYLRDAALAQALVTLVSSDGEQDSYLSVHEALVTTVGFDVVPEWSGNAIDDPLDSRQVVAYQIAEISDSDPLSIEKIFIAHLRILEWAIRSNHKAGALQALARRVRADWTKILAERRALLLMPALNAPAIDAVLMSGGEDGAFVARVLLVAERAVSVNLAAEMRTFLESVRGNE